MVVNNVLLVVEGLAQIVVMVAVEADVLARHVLTFAFFCSESNIESNSRNVCFRQNSESRALWSISSLPQARTQKQLPSSVKQMINEKVQRSQQVSQTPIQA